MAETSETTPQPQEVKVLADEKAQKDDVAGADISHTAHINPHESNASPPKATAEASHPSKVSSPPNSAPSSPPVSPPISSPPSPEHGRISAIEAYHAARPRFDKLGNPLPERRTHGAMSSVYGVSKVNLPGDLGRNDPRRPRSPALAALPGDLGAKDPRRPRSQNSSPGLGHRRKISEGFDSPDRDARIPEDPPHHLDDHDADSDGDADADNDNESEEEESGRGRTKVRPEPGKTTAGKAVNVREDSADSEVAFPQFQGGHKPDPTRGESAISFKLTAPPGKKRVHPSTAFDFTPSSTPTPLGSDDESHSELRAAQKLSLSMSAIHSTPSAHRVIRQIIRGDYSHFQHEAEEGRKRQRMYLVASDLSPESEYALEWTIGTVLRDGDTLFAVYAVDEESGVGGEGGVGIGEGADCVKDTASIVNGLQSSTILPQSPGPSPLSKVTGTDVRSRSQGVYSNAETERRRALESITDLCVRLLRKTRLQVRVVVEVFHCKSPRHMITEVIDFLSPTLVIIGSRGRSAVKGVLLGSFSNYLVTKSSIPVMVARKKLRKHSKTVRNKDGTLVPYTNSGRSGRFSNVIEAPKNKGLRVQGWDKVGID